MYVNVEFKMIEKQSSIYWKLSKMFAIPFSEKCQMCNAMNKA